MNYIIIFKVKDDSKFKELIRKQFDWWCFVDNSFVIKTSWSIESIRNMLIETIDKEKDIFFIFRIQKPYRTFINNQLAIDWLNESIGNNE